MFRPRLRLSRKICLTSAGAAAAALVLNEEPPKKLSIYPSSAAEIVLVETPTPLETQIGVARRGAMHAYRDAHARVQGLVSRWIGVEHAIENRVKAIIPANETLTPGILYVGIATLTGSILARNRFLPTRLLLPPAFLLMSMHHFLPQTTANLSTYLASLEDTYFPIAAEKHDIANAHMRMTWDRLKAATESGREGLGRGVVTAVDKAQAITGLKLKETLGWTQEKVVETTRVAEKKVTEVTEEAQKKSEDVKRLV